MSVPRWPVEPAPHRSAGDQPPTKPDHDPEPAAAMSAEATEASVTKVPLDAVPAQLSVEAVSQIEPDP